MINKRLFEHYNIDTNKNLHIQKRCGRPFDTVLIDSLGSCYACECTAWLPQSIGNIQVQPMEEILSSAKRKHLQQSIDDHSYRYCNQAQCSYLQKLGILESERQEFTIRLAIDNSCNLQCPSCRTDRIFVSRGVVLTRKKAWIDKVVEWINKQTRPIRIVIGSDGDPFASLVYRYFMTQAENHQWNHVTYDFQTNGMLVSKMYQRYQWVFDRTEVLNISVDGSTAEVYEKLRKGGSFEKLLENFQFLQNVKRKFQVHLHMVVQKVNWHQMPAVFKMLDRYGFERAYFNLIQDWGTNININEQTEFVNQLKYNEIKAELSKDIRARLHQLS